MRDKNNLSHPETPVFMRVVREYVRDEGFFFVLQQFLDFCFEVFDLGGKDKTGGTDSCIPFLSERC